MSSSSFVADAWSVDGFRLCYVRPSPVDTASAASSLAVTDLVAAPPTLPIAAVHARLPLLHVAADSAAVTSCEISALPPPVDSSSADVLARVAAAVRDSFNEQRDLSADVVALACQQTPDQWRAALPLPPSRAFSVAHLIRLCERCRGCEPLCDAVLVDVLPKLAAHLVFDDERDDDDDDGDLPHEIVALLDLVAAGCSLRRVPLALLETHALLEPLVHAHAHGALFRQHLLLRLLALARAQID